MSDPMAEIRASYFVECEELLESLQDGLEQMEDGNDDSETINVVFRAVHSIKGGAGAFGLDDLVKFAHRFETAMDEVRAGRFAPDSTAIKLFFQCSDILADLVRAARDDEVIPADRTDPVLDSLDEMVGTSEEVEEEIEFAPMVLSLDLGGGGTSGLPDLPGLPALPGLPDLPGLPELDSALPLPPVSPDSPTGQTDNSGNQLNHFRILFGPENSLYSSGNEPLYLLRALRDLGEIKVRCDTSALPGLDDLNPENGYLSWIIELSTEENQTTVREVFEFVDGLCDLDIETADDTALIAENTVAQQPELTVTAEPDTSAARLPDLVPEIADILPDVTPEPEVAPALDKEPEPMDTSTAEYDVQSAAGAQSSAKATPTQPRATVRVDLERIDRLVNLVGELVINQAMLSQSVAETSLPQNSPVQTGLEEFLQLTRDIQESVMMIRAQPIKSLFQRMSRIVRESSAMLGKDVRLFTDGENTEVDKTVIERLADPLTHMIRNAVDHGLESTADRIATGKEPVGHVTLTANHRSGRIVIDVTDDGAGINREKVRQIAINKELIAADAQLSDTDIDNLLFLPGFSTADKVSNLSGRGVGMDVVKSAILGLGGRISISSVEGKGTTFSISLPLTLAVLDGMVVQVAGETLVVPLNAIIETLTLTEDDLRALGPQTHVVQIRGGFDPLLDLGAELGYRAPKDSYIGDIVLLIGQEDGKRAALVVDAIEDQRQVVIKGLEASYGRVAGIAAATILGDGQIALILDPVDLVSEATGRTRVPPKHLSIAG
jgi:two-component system, chemotaxis family, sensor kinase CheA